MCTLWQSTTTATYPLSVATVHKLVHCVAVSSKGRATAPSKLSEVASCELPAELAEHYASTLEQRLLDQVLHAARRTIAVCARLDLTRQAKPSSGKSGEASDP